MYPALKMAKEEDLKIIEGIKISLQSNQENFFFLYGQQHHLEKEIAKNKLIGVLICSFPFLIPFKFSQNFPF